MNIKTTSITIALIATALVAACAEKTPAPTSTQESRGGGRPAEGGHQQNQ